MLPQFFRFVVFNNTGVTNTYNDGGIITLKHTGIYVAPSTGLLTYAGFTADTMNFDTGRSMADGGEVYDDSSLCHSAEINNSSSLYINTLVQLEVTHSLAATASGTFDIYLSTGTTTAELQTDDIPGKITTAHSTTNGKIDVVDGIVDNILTDTGTTLVAQITALNNLSITDIFERVIEGSTTFEQTMRGIVSVCFGIASGGGTNSIKFRNIADDTDRIIATVDASGNRTAVTLDLS